MGITKGQILAEFPELSDLRQVNASSTKLVFSAEHKTRGACILKVMNPRRPNAASPREGRILERLSRCRVPELFVAGTIQTPVGSCAYHIEREISGVTVADLLAKRTLDKHELERMSRQLLETLVAMEDLGIAHRDLKPTNVLSDAAGNFWLIDFDLAWHVAVEGMSDVDAFARRVTFGYSAPERYADRSQAIALSADIRSDLFSLGVTIHEAATGENPFRQGTSDSDEIVERVRAMPLPPLPDSVPARLGVAVRAATAKSAADRPASARRMLALIADEPLGEV
jgi:serine/threonine protein kinase